MDDSILPNYSRVRLLTDKYQEDGAKFGDLGYIIEVYDGAYEVEFSDKNGITIATIVVSSKEIALDEPV
jgi:hypothetical protein